MITQNDIHKLYKKYGVSASKRFGQNFLHNEKILNKIIEALDIKGKHIMEIGPGLGSLTMPLLESAKEVSSYEIDPEMIRVLEGEIKNDNFHLIKGDFLKADLDWSGKRTIIANIPYNITSDILFKLFRNANKVSEAVLMMQKEVGERLTAPVGSKHYGKLTVSTQLFADVEKIVLVPPNYFVPAPKVTSIVVKLMFKETSFNEELLLFIKNCFAHRRKTLFNNLRNFIPAVQAKEVIKELKLKESVRPQELTKDEFLKLFKLIK